MTDCAWQGVGKLGAEIYIRFLDGFPANDTYTYRFYKFKTISCLFHTSCHTHAFHLPTPPISNLTHSTLTVAAANNAPTITLLFAYSSAARPPRPNPTATLAPPEWISAPATGVPNSVPNPRTIYRNPFTLAKFCTPNSSTSTVGNRLTYAPANTPYNTANATNSARARPFPPTPSPSPSCPARVDGNHSPS